MNAVLSKLRQLCFPTINPDLEIYLLTLTFKRTFHCSVHMKPSAVYYWILDSIKNWMLLACEPLEFQLCYPLGSQELKFCLFYYVEIFRDLGPAFKFVFFGKPFWLLFFCLSSPCLLKLSSPEKVALLFKSLLADWPSLRCYFCLLGKFKFQGKEKYCSYLTLWEFKDF